jgi:hypothetical protein
MTMTPLDDEIVIATDELAADEQVDAFHALVQRLSAQSVTKHFDAYADIPWDEPEFRVDPDDPRWILTPEEPLGATDWYQRQPAAIRSRIGLYRIALNTKRGMQFENILERGLLSYVFHHVGNDDPTFRYVLHEVTEETHHSMMFQEFANRSGTDPAGLPWIIRLASSWVILQARLFPPLFFYFVLGGEDPIDHVQREALRSGKELAPINEIIMRHHVTEEARHISFARHYLKIEVPRLKRTHRAFLSIVVPIMLGQMAGLMLAEPPDLTERFGVPREVLREASHNHDSVIFDPVRAVRKLRRLTRELGLMNPVATRLWKHMGLWAED